MSVIEIRLERAAARRLVRDLLGGGLTSAEPLVLRLDLAAAADPAASPAPAFVPGDAYEGPVEPSHANCDGLFAEAHALVARLPEARRARAQAQLDGRAGDSVRLGELIDMLKAAVARAENPLATAAVATPGASASPEGGPK